MSDGKIEPFGCPAVGRKKVTAAFDGGRITSDGRVMLLAAAERRLGIAERLAALISDARNPLLVTHSVADSRAEWLYDTLYCAHGQAENLIKLHKSQLASDRTSCRSALANQVRLVLHTAAYWLMLTVRNAIPRQQPLACAEFATLRVRPIKIAARVTEAAARVRVAFPAACLEAPLFAGIARRLQPCGP